MSEKHRAEVETGTEANVEGLGSRLALPQVRPDLNIMEYLRHLGFAIIFAATPTEAAAQDTGQENSNVQIEQILPHDLIASIEAAGYSVKIQIPSENGDYLIHVGQLHTSPFPELRAIGAEAVREHQRNSELILPKLAALGDGVIFDEGEARSMAQIERDKAYVISLASSIDHLAQKEPTGYEEIISSYQLLTNYTKIADHSFVLNSIDPTVVQQAFDTLIRSIVSYEPVNESERAHIASIKQHLDVMIAVHSNIDRKQQDAVIKLYMQGILKIAPAERTETNQQAIKTADAYRRIQHSYEQQIESVFKSSEAIRLLTRLSDLEKQTPNEDLEIQKNKIIDELLALEAKRKKEIEFTPIGNAYRNAKAQMDIWANTRREEEALLAIEAYTKEHGPLDFAILRFGSNHDFTNVVARTNHSAPKEERFGLVKITPNTADK